MIMHNATLSAFFAGSMCHKHLMHRRYRANYKPDGGTSANPHPKLAADDCCNKEERWHNTLLPGIFVVMCVHGVCYGVTVMRRHESPRTLFDFIFNRFAIPPVMIIYDNACHFQKYAMAREPGYFSQCSARIDRLHQPGHCRQVV